MSGDELQRVTVYYRTPIELNYGEISKKIVERVSGFSQTAVVMGQLQVTTLMCGSHPCLSVTITFNSERSNQTEGAVRQIVAVLEAALEFTDVIVTKEVIYADSSGVVEVKAAGSAFTLLFKAHL